MADTLTLLCFQALALKSLVLRMNIFSFFHYKHSNFMNWTLCYSFWVGHSKCSIQPTESFKLTKDSLTGRNKNGVWQINADQELEHSLPECTAKLTNTLNRRSDWNCVCKLMHHPSEIGRRNNTMEHFYKILCRSYRSKICRT